MHIIKLFWTCVFPISLTACASPPIQPVTVVVGNNAIQVMGVSVNTADELRVLLAEKKISRIELRTEPDTDYETIGRVIYGMSRNKVKIEAINGEVLK